MTNYLIEANKNFYEELYKSLDDESDDDTNVCQITGLPLSVHAITLECKHQFNYESLYKEICRQKYDFKTYDLNTLIHKDQQKVRESKLDYFIKCPYCRNIQFTILPYYDDLGFDKKYGVNSLDVSLRPLSTSHNENNQPGVYYGSDDYTYTLYGKLFKKGQCCHTITSSVGGNVLCSSKYVTTIEGISLSYCKYHYKSKLKDHKLLERKKIIENKKNEKEKKLKEKEEKLNERKKLFDETNAIRIEKGKPPLKRLPRLKQKVENVVESVQEIGQYVPDNEDIDVGGCNSIIKSGSNKGKKCGCKKIYENGLCKRHSQK